MNSSSHSSPPFPSRGPALPTLHALTFSHTANRLVLVAYFHLRSLPFLLCKGKAGNTAVARRAQKKRATLFASLDKAVLAPYVILYPPALSLTGRTHRYSRVLQARASHSISKDPLSISHPTPPLNWRTLKPVPWDKSPLLSGCRCLDWIRFPILAGSESFLLVSVRAVSDPSYHHLVQKIYGKWDSGS